jgi:hypothetical protein
MPFFSKPSTYQIPRWNSPADFVHGWLREASEEGENYLKNQRAWQDLDRAMDIISGGGMQRIPKAQSKVHLNMLKRDIRESIATLSNIRPMSSYKTDNDYLMKQAAVLNKLYGAWYLNTFADRAVRSVLQWTAAGGLGWASPGWSKDFWVRGRGDIELKTYSPRDVIPIQIGKDHDVQKAYAVTIRDETPITQAWAKYPTKADLLTPDRGTASWLQKGVRKVQRFMSPVLNVFGQGRGKDSDGSPFPTVDIFRTYILDLSYNDTDRPIRMGDGNWNYEVPPYGSDIPTGEMNGGVQRSRKATFEDSQMFPLRRLVIWCNNGILYDDSSTLWSGKVPAIPFRLDDWPWDLLGYPMTRDGASVQESATRLLRAIDDSANARLDPPLAYDENMMSRALMERFNPRAGGQRLPVNMQMGDGVKELIGSNYYDVPSWIPEFIWKLYEGMHYCLGTRDIQAIAKARQVPSGDSLEKLMELAGPLLTDMSRNMEYSMREVGEQVKSLLFQHYDLPRRVQVLGKDGVVEEDFDFKPGDMVPSHTPDEFELIRTGKMKQTDSSRLSNIARAKIHQNSFFFHIAPNSMHQITQLTKKLLLMQLYRTGFPIDPWSVAEGFDIENYGDPQQLHNILQHDIPSDKFGRWLAFMEFKQKLGQREAGHPGRKPSGQVPPTVQTKSDGTRSTIRESPR